MPNDMSLGKADHMYKTHGFQSTYFAGYINQEYDSTGYWISLVSSLGAVFSSYLMQRMEMLFFISSHNVVMNYLPTATTKDAKQSPRFTFDTTNNISMSCNSEVNNFEVGDNYPGDVND